MTTITVPLPEERLEQLRQMAQRAGVSPEDLARAGLEDWLRQPREDFLLAARYVLQKNAELYRRLGLMRYLTLDEVIELHRLTLEQAGGAGGVRDLGALESAVAQPYMAFGGEDLYPAVAEKASALAFALVKNHPFVDGDKRAGHAAMEVFLVLNGHELSAATDEQERIMLGLAAGAVGREEFTAWVRAHLLERGRT